MGAVMFTTLAGITEGPAAVTRLSAADLGAIAYLALLVTVAAFVLWYTTVAALGPGRVGLLTGIAPVAAALTGIATGGRAPSPLMWAGMGVVLTGLGAGLWSRSRPRPGPVPRPGTLASCAVAPADGRLD
jgi:drug/metabolite transporter (DMT)-like permease